MKPYANPSLPKRSLSHPARRSVLVGSIALSMLIGCGGGTDDGADKACSDLAQSQCAKRQSCTDSIDPAGFNVESNFGDMTTCLAREKMACLNNLSAPENGNSPQQVEKCVDAFPTYACADFLGANPPDACAPMGHRTTGQPCSFNSQCESRYCSNDKTATCGTCAPSPAADTPCASSNCGHRQTCVAATMLCQDRGELGASCDAAHPCGVEMSCSGLTATTAKTCQAALVNEGDPCLGATLPGCRSNLGLACRAVVGPRACARVTLVGDGEVCGLLPDGSRADCRAGDCFTATGLAANADLGTCKALVDAGAACDTSLGPNCLVPARCVPSGASGTSGTCQTPTGSSCG